MSFQFLCVGDLDVDLLATVSRLPEVDDKVSGRRVGLAVGGMSANVAVGLARLGSAARLVAAVGDDRYGDFAGAELAREGVDTRFLVRRADTATFMCVVLLTEGGEKSLVRLESDAYLPRPEDTPADAFTSARHVHLTMGNLALTQHCIALAKDHDATVSLDLEQADVPADPTRLGDLLQEIDWLFLNRRTRDHLEDLLGGQALASARRVITTLGANGCRLDQADEHLTAGAHGVKVRDTTGAGDAFAAAFLHYHLAQGRSAGEALRSANAAGALVVQQYGAQAGLPTPGEVASVLKRPCGAD